MIEHKDGHRMCGACWITTVSARLPRTEGYEEGGIMQCCYCGRPTSSGIRRLSATPPHCPERDKEPAKVGPRLVVDSYAFKWDFAQALLRSRARRRALMTPEELAESLALEAAEKRGEPYP